MAEKGKHKKVRFQGGTVFPITIAVVAVLGLALIIYSRTSTKALAVPPQASNSDHWHVAFGIYQCDDWLPNIAGNKEGTDTGVPDEEYVATGVHSHDDGVIHYHPFTAKASGQNAKLGVFLDVYDIELSDDKLVMPDDQGGLVLEEGVTTCTNEDGDEVDGQLSLAVWDDASQPDDYRILTSDMAGARIDRNGMAMAIFFTPEGTEVVAPPSAAELEALGAADTGTTPDGAVTGDTSTSVAGSGSSTTTGEPSDASSTTVSDSTTSTSG